MKRAYKSQAAKDAQKMSYGDVTYWEYLDNSAQSHYEYFMKRGNEEKAKEMFSRSLTKALEGNDGE